MEHTHTHHLEKVISLSIYTATHAVQGYRYFAITGVHHTAFDNNNSNTIVLISKEPPESLSFL